MSPVASRLRQRPSTTLRSVAKPSSKPARPMSSTRAIITSAGGRRSMLPRLSSLHAPNTRLRKTQSRHVRKTIGNGFKIIGDADVVLASKGDSSLPIPLRRIKVRRDKGGMITLITNDLKRTAVEIAALYKSRWQIELLFRWIKQHLNLRKFMGKNDNAIRLQILAAMIAYLLLRLARRLNSLRMLDLRFAELVCQRLFMRKPIAEIDTPPPVNPSKPKPKFSPDQLGFNYV